MLVLATSYLVGCELNQETRVNSVNDDVEAGRHYSFGSCELDRLVKFIPLDMNDLSPIASDTFDFMWSTCSIEHVGRVTRSLHRYGG